MLLKLLTLGGLGFLGYKAYEQAKIDRNGVAFADGEPKGAFRNAGPKATTTDEKGWSKTDEELDETYPASDPPANY